MLFEFSEVIVPCDPKSSHSCRPVAGIYLSYSLLRKTRWIPAKDREDDRQRGCHDRARRPVTSSLGMVCEKQCRLLHPRASRKTSGLS